MSLSYRHCVVWELDGLVQFTWAVDEAMGTDVRDGGVYDTTLSRRLVYPGRETKETEDEFMRRIAEGGPAVGALTPDAGAVPAGVPYQIMDGQTVKQFNEANREFRGAFLANLSVDMPKARELWREHLRRDALEKTRIAEQKQVLRDLPGTPQIEAAVTPDELKALRSELGR